MKAAPIGPTSDCMVSDATLSLWATPLVGKHQQVGAVHEQVDDGGDGETQYDGQGHPASRILDFLRHVGRPVPPVVGAEGCHHAEADQAEEPDGERGIGRPYRLEITRVGRDPEGQGDHEEQPAHLEEGRKILDETAEPNAQVIDEGQDDQGDNRHAPHGPVRVWTELADEISQVGGKYDGDGRQVAGTYDQEGGPPEEKTPQPPVGFLQKYVQAARSRHHAAQFGESQRAAEGHEGADDPDQEVPAGSTHVSGHDGGTREDAGTDDPTDDHGRRRDRSQVPLEFGLFPEGIGSRVPLSIAHGCLDRDFPDGLLSGDVLNVVFISVRVND